MYAAGKIPGGFIKREGRPTENAILAARVTDRTIRPLFPKGFKNETQIINTVLSADQENDPDILGADRHLDRADDQQIPFDGPVAAVRIGLIDGQLVVNPTEPQMTDSKLDLVVAGSADAIVMVEGNAEQTHRRADGRGARTRPPRDPADPRTPARLARARRAREAGLHTARPRRGAEGEVLAAWPRRPPGTGSLQPRQGVAAARRSVRCGTKSSPH